MRKLLSLGLGMLLWGMPMLAQAQQHLSCEERLAKAKAQIDLMLVQRDRADETAAEALAVVRMQRDALQTQVQKLREQLKVHDEKPDK